MKHSLFLIAALALMTNMQAQVLKNATNRVKQKLEQKSNQKIDKTVDDAVDGKMKTQESAGNPDVVQASNSEPTAAKSQPKSLKAYSKFDFVPGDKILYAEDFSQDAIGEFPAKWNTDGSGEVVTLEGVPGKWLNLIERTTYESPYRSKLPENFTIEYDLITEYKDDQGVPNINTIIYREPEKNRQTGSWLKLYPNGGTSAMRDAAAFHNQNEKGYTDLQAKTQYLTAFNESNHKVQPVHVSIWVQKERVRAWVNQEKIYDLPKGMPAEALPEKLAFELGSYGGPKENYRYYISNIKIAEASADTRNKLLTEGVWSTSGILFDVASDRIRPTSFGVLKQIAGVLTENPGVRVKIIGHTDSDGEEAANLELSKRRAAAVKSALASEFGIDAARLESDGMGEGKPVADNVKPEGKAQNRRVEFVKL
jgi:outer membrane protein OmpA-like peptidoglycan-associated protein